MGFYPIVLCKQPNKGNTIIEKLEEESENICYSIVIYTACDLGHAKENAKEQPRARQNVVFEHGYMCAKLGRSHVVALVEAGVETPGDLSGIVYISLDEAGAWRTELAKNMRAIGLPVDMNRL